jgi:hypothetical protein
VFSKGIEKVRDSAEGLTYGGDAKDKNGFFLESVSILQQICEPGERCLTRREERNEEPFT